MKWIAIVLVLLNVIALLLGLKVEPEHAQAAGTSANSSEYNAINAAGISVIIPQDPEASDSSMVAEEGLAQLKVNSNGQVLMARNKQQNSDLQKLPVINSASETQTPTQEQTQNQVQAEVAPQTEKTIVETPSVETSSVEKGTDIARASVPAKTPTPSAKEALACYRLGPFTKQDNLANTRKKLVDSGIAFKLDEEKVQGKVTATNVYLGGFANREALDKQKKQLVQLNIDHFAKTIDGESALQLGSFSDVAHATAYQNKMKAKGLTAKLHRVQAAGSGMKSWLAVVQVSQSAVSGLNLPNRIKADPQACP